MIEFYNEILNYVQRLSGDKHLAQDLTQETYAKALHLKVHEKVENKRAYLYKIAKHLVFDESRKKKNVQEIIYTEENYEISPSLQTEEIIEKKDKNTLLLQCINTLSPKNKEAFYLYVIEGYSRKEIAVKMNIGISAVEKNIQRASIKVQEELEKGGFRDEY